MKTPEETRKAKERILAAAVYDSGKIVLHHMYLLVSHIAIIIPAFDTAINGAHAKAVFLLNILQFVHFLF